MTKLGQELVQSAQEALGIAKGESQPARIVEASDLDVAAIRKRLGLSQGQFARKSGYPLPLCATGSSGAGGRTASRGRCSW